MCGITGLMHMHERKPLDDALLRKMTDRLTHRGPDASGYHFDEGFGFGHRRLSIIDLDSGQQPMRSADQRFVLTFNGEIYNYQELRDELIRCGRSFATESDTEVLLQAWQQWGEDCLPRLNGMFAFGIFDTVEQTLFLARDAIGIKPLYYAPMGDGWLSFGSELKALQCCPSLSRTIDICAVEEYFTFGYIPDPRTIYSGVFKLPPAHYLKIERGKRQLVEPVRYWQLHFRDEQTASLADLEAELLERLDAAVRSQMVSDVPLGAFLSGGVDSSAVVASMAQVSAEPVSTCSIGFREAQYDESAYAAMVANRYNTRHDSRIVDSDDFALARRLIELYDEPYADSSALPTYRVCELARNKVTVALSGDGGDESYAGYTRYRWHMNEEKVRSVLPQQLRGPVFGWLGRHYPKLDWAPKVFRAKTTFESLGMAPETAYLHSVSMFPETLRARLFSAELVRDLDGYSAKEVFHRHAADGPDDALSKIQYLDFQTYLPGDILTKVDRASMAHSLEVRVPILDHTLVEWAASVPREFRIKDGEGKYLLKRALRERLPADLLYRKKKGFTVPIEQWFRGPLREEIAQAVTGERLTSTGYFQRKELERLVTEHQSGRSNYTGVLWALMIFDGFLQREMG